MMDITHKGKRPLRTFFVTCCPAVYQQPLSEKTQKTESPEIVGLMWKEDMGVAVLAFTTKQGSVFEPSSAPLLLVYWHIVCSWASGSRRRAVNVGKGLVKQTAQRLFFRFCWSPAVLNIGLFLVFKCCKWSQLSHFTWTGYLQTEYCCSPGIVSNTFEVFNAEVSRNSVYTSDYKIKTAIEKETKHFPQNDLVNYTVYNSFKGMWNSQ